MELSASGALSAVTATMEVNVHRPQVPVSVSLAIRARAARSGSARRACMARAAPCPVPATLRTLSAAIQSLELVPANQAGLATTAMSPALPATMAMVANCPAPARMALTATASLGAVLVHQASWERCVRFPALRGPMVPTAHLYVAAAMAAPVPLWTAPAPAKRGGRAWTAPCLVPVGPGA